MLYLLAKVDQCFHTSAKDSILYISDFIYLNEFNNRAVGGWGFNGECIICSIILKLI